MNSLAPEDSGEWLRELKTRIHAAQQRATLAVQNFLGLKHREHFRAEILKPLLESKKLLPTLPDKPKSPKQRYVASRHSREGGNP